MGNDIKINNGEALIYFDPKVSYRSCATSANVLLQKDEKELRGKVRCGSPLENQQIQLKKLKV